MRHRVVLGVLIALCLTGVWHLALAGKFYAKAVIADHLINDAWQTHLAKQTPTKPWSWADTWPVAKLLVPRLNVKQIVLMGDSGRILAFGPGLTESSAIPGELGLSVISGHRDTYFQFLKEIRQGDQLIMQTKKGSTSFLVEELAIVDQREISINRELFGESEEAQIMLVTCYPFDALTAGGDMRYVVIAKSQHNVL